MCLLVAVRFHSQFALGYTYDAAGNRIEKKYCKSGVDHYTWYERDAQGNTMAVYEKTSTTTVPYACPKRTSTLVCLKGRAAAGWVWPKN